MAVGLAALLDDIAAIAKLAAASVDDVGAAAGKATVKAAGVVVDDAAVTAAAWVARLSVEWPGGRTEEALLPLTPSRLAKTLDHALEQVLSHRVQGTEVPEARAS